MILWTASSCTPVPPANCLAAVHPDQRTRDWLKTLKPPEYAKAYFDKIKAQEQAIDEVCQ